MPARVWPCRSCGILLGICHCILGCFLLIFDLVTNNETDTSLGVSSALVFIICAMFAFISAKRLDRAAQLILLTFSLISVALCLALFFENAIMINRLCRGHDLEGTEVKCYGKKAVLHTILFGVSLCELVVSFITAIVCFRSLRHAYAVMKPYSPYSTMIVGDYDQLFVYPETIEEKNRPFVW
uniref:Zgc: n=1 Tax=Steinernema glaseri TaxID=37863 RepID=A0A1I8A2F4_9BILA